METKDKFSIGYFQAAGLLALMPSLCFWILWVLLHSASEKMTPVEKTALYLRYFPEILKDTHLVFVIASVTIFAAVLLSILKIRTVSRPFKILGLITITIGTLLFIFHVSTMI